MNKIALICFIFLLSPLAISTGFANEMNLLTVPQLTAKIADVEKQNISLTGTIAGACMSGCKVWLTEGEYKKGDPVILVWAKDDAFKFKTDAAGKKVKLQGFAVGKYIDLCATEKKQEEGAMEKESCAKPVILKDGKEKQLEAVTFFATKVDYF